MYLQPSSRVHRLAGHYLGWLGQDGVDSVDIPDIPSIAPSVPDLTTVDIGVPSSPPDFSSITSMPIYPTATGITTNPAQAVYSPNYFSPAASAGSSLTSAIAQMLGSKGAAGKAPVSTGLVPSTGLSSTSKYLLFGGIGLVALLVLRGGR